EVEGMSVVKTSLTSNDMEKAPKKEGAHDLRRPHDCSSEDPVPFWISTDALERMFTLDETMRRVMFRLRIAMTILKCH
ncbi:hypothetical protein NPIL_271311, partial [Nephila pilipes]